MQFVPAVQQAEAQAGLVYNPNPAHVFFQESDGDANASCDSDDTLILDDNMYCQKATNDFAKENNIPPCKSGSFKEHTFLVEIKRFDKDYAKCLFCTKEFEIEIESKKNVFLGSYIHMSCVLYDDKVHILRYIEDVKKFEDTNIVLRKILMTPNMLKNSYNEQWNPANISGCITAINPIKPVKKCRLVNLPHN